jgi:hypothetical protein
MKASFGFDVIEVNATLMQICFWRKTVIQRWCLYLEHAAQEIG